jgi:hypothetical protein
MRGWRTIERMSASVCAWERVWLNKSTRAAERSIWAYTSKAAGPATREGKGKRQDSTYVFANDLLQGAR